MIIHTSTGIIVLTSTSDQEHMITHGVTVTFRLPSAPRSGHSFIFIANHLDASIAIQNSAGSSIFPATKIREVEVYYTPLGTWRVIRKSIQEPKVYSNDPGIPATDVSATSPIEYVVLSNMPNGLYFIAVTFVIASFQSGFTIFLAMTNNSDSPTYTDDHVQITYGNSWFGTSVTTSKVFRFTSNTNRVHLRVNIAKNMTLYSNTISAFAMKLD